MLPDTQFPRCFNNEIPRLCSATFPDLSRKFMNINSGLGLEQYYGDGDSDSGNRVGLGTLMVAMGTKLWG